jgi:hypothetical protein
VLCRIGPEAEGLLGVVACCGSWPSRPHDPTGAAQQPPRPGRLGRGARIARCVGEPVGIAHAGKGGGAGQGDQRRGSPQ